MTEISTCACGCGTEIKAGRTWAVGHNRRQQFSDYEVDENGCWVWQKTRSPNNKTAAITGEAQYGVIDGQSAHRIYYERYRRPLKAGEEVDHCCPNGSNTLCVNPDHLQAVSHRTNVRRSKVTRLSANDVREIRRLREMGTGAGELAMRYGVTSARIYQLTTGVDAKKEFEDS